MPNRFLDWLIPAYEPVDKGCPTFFVYTEQKNLELDGKIICPLVEPLFDEYAPEGYGYVSLGELNGEELIESTNIRRDYKWFEVFASLLFWRKGDFEDLKFLLILLRHYWLAFPRKNLTIFALRSFLISRYFALKFRRYAQLSDRAYVVCYYNAMMLGVVSAFRRENKEVWDVQHGFLGDSHEGYNNRKAYELDSTYKPTGFVVWDQRFKDYIERTLNLSTRCTNYSHIKAYNRLPVDDDKNVNRVLYTLQWGMPVPDSVFEAAAANSDLEWVFRMHPVDKDARADLDRLKELPNVKVVPPNTPLVEDILRCTVHMTYNSSVINEAASLGKPSLFLDEEYIERFQYETERGLAIYVEPGTLQHVLSGYTAHGE